MNPHSITLGGITLGGLDRVDGFAFREISGWYGAPGLRGSLDAIPGNHGSFARVDKYRDSAAITIEGSIVADSRSDVEALISTATQAWESATTLTVVDETGAWSRAVEVDQVSFPENQGWMRHVTFTIDMIAPDPVRYRDVVVLGPVGLPVLDGGLFLPASMPWDLGVDVRSVLTVVNDGSVPVFPVVRLSGSASSVVVLAGPRRLGFGAFTGDLVFDAADRRGFLNGADVTRQMTRRDWPVVPAGATHEFTFEAVAPSPDFRMSVEYRIGAW